MKAATDKTKKIILIIGVLLIGGTLLLNEQLLAALFPDSLMTMPAGLKIGVLVVDALFALAVIFLLVSRRPPARISADVLVGIGFTLFLLAGIEVAFYYLNQQKQGHMGEVVFEFTTGGESGGVSFSGEHPRALFERDDWLGYRPVPNTQVIASRKAAEELLYRVHYSIDSVGRRVTPVDPLSPHPEYILFFGGSYTFGEGVNDDQTMPYYVSALAPAYRAYNYGAGGYGPQQMLAKLQSEDMTAEIEEPQGMLIYTFIGEHILRAIGSMRIHIQRGEVMPYYYIDTAGNLIRQGDLASGRPGLSILYSILGKSQTLKLFNIDIPLKLSEEDFRATARIIEEARNVYREKFGSDRFYVLIYPGFGAPELLPYLDAANITYLDYSDLPDIYNEDFWLGEGHPTAKAHRIVAEKLVQDLGLQESAEK